MAYSRNVLRGWFYGFDMEGTVDEETELALIGVLDMMWKADLSKIADTMNALANLRAAQGLPDYDYRQDVMAVLK